MNEDLARLRRWLGRARPPRAQLARALLTGFVASAANVALVVGAAALLVESATRPGLRAVAVVLVLIELVAFLRSPLRFLERLSAHRLGYDAVTRWRQWLVTTVGSFTYSRWRTYAAGDLLERALADTDELQDLWLRFVIPFGDTLAVMVLGDVVVALLEPEGHWWAYAVVLLVVQVLAIGGLALLALRAVDADRAVRVARAQHRGHLVELASAVPEMALLNREDLAVARLSNAVSTLDRAEAAQRRQRRGANALVALGGLLALSAVVLRPRTSSVWLVVATLVGLATFDALNAVRSSLRAAVEVAGGAERLESLGEVATKGARPWPDDTTLRLEGVTLREDGRTLVDAGSFAVNPGERVAVVGDSGVGKSTLLRALATLDDHHLGSITVGGHALSELDEGDLRRHLAYVPAEPGLTRGYALDVVALGRASVRDSLDDLARLGLTVERTTRFDELSRGERARVALARALVTDPAILVLDEPTAGLGELETRNVLDLLAGTAATVIVATHDAQVVAWCDVVVTLRSDGQLRVTR